MSELARALASARMNQTETGPTAQATAQRLSAAWLALGVASLGASTLFALLLVASRTPYVGAWLPRHDFFRVALVLHVNLSVTIWFLAFAASLWSFLGSPRFALWGWIGFWFAAAGATIVAVAPFAGPAAPLMSNYVPVLYSSFFLYGLGLFGVGYALALLRALVCAGSGWRENSAQGAWRFGAYAAAVAAALALFSFAWSLIDLPRNLYPGLYFEVLFWSSGHGLQFSHTLLMMAAWLWLADGAGIVLPLQPRVAKWLLALGLAPAFLIPAIHFAYPVTGAEFRQAFTQLMRWGSWIAALPLALAIAPGMWRGARRETRPLRIALVLSLLLFVSGIIIGALIRQDNAMVPAHYHGAIGAVTLAFMALAIHLLPRLGLAPPPPGQAVWQHGWYGLGTLLMAWGLAWSGGRGVARKVPGSAQILDGFPEIAGMAAMGLGGLIAVIGSLLFFFLVYRSLPALSRGFAPATTRADRRPLALALTVAMIVALGTAVHLLPAPGGGSSLAQNLPPDPRTDPKGHERQARSSEIALRFQQGVAMLHARQYEHAATAFHRVLALEPTLPEAHVNMGFAMLGLERNRVALDFFESAAELRPMQANAYYGMAVAMDALGDTPGALGAMQSYLHLTQANDPYRRKAEAAVWEWQAALDRSRAEENAKKFSKSPESLPESGKTP